jgi:very-short-patch-repair endonuclease
MQNEPIHNRQALKEIRRELRNNPTDEETVLWNYLKGKKLGHKIRRQHSIGNCIVDFYCPQKRIAIELDGAHHFTTEGKESDKQRDKFLNTLNIKVLRFANSRVRSDLNNVLNEIKYELNTLP